MSNPPITREALAIRAADAAAAWMNEPDAKKSLPLWSKMMSAVKAYDSFRGPDDA